VVPRINHESIEVVTLLSYQDSTTGTIFPPAPKFYVPASADGLVVWTNACAQCPCETAAVRHLCNVELCSISLTTMVGASLTNTCPKIAQTQAIGGIDHAGIRGVSGLCT